MGKQIYIWENYHLVRCLPYHSPHKFRQWFAVYGIKKAKDIGELKTISQNLMHSSISIDDGVYGGLSIRDMASQLNKLGDENNVTLDKDQTEVLDLLSQILDLLKKDND